MSTIFGIEESTKFAKALAASENIKIIQRDDNAIPSSTKDGSIRIGTPSIYGHDEYIGNLHKEIGKQSCDMKFFHNVNVEKNELQHASKMILQGLRTEYHMHGMYEGRDRILKEQYQRDVQKAGGISSLISSVSRDNKTLASLLYVGNELRNDWQGYQHCELPKDLEGEVKRLSFLKDEWLSIDSEEDLQRILERIQYEEYNGNSNSGNEESDEDGEGSQGEGGDPQDGEGESKDSQSSQEQSQGSTGEGEKGEQGESSQSSEGREGGNQGDTGQSDESSDGDGEDGKGESGTSQSREESGSDDTGTDEGDSGSQGVQGEDGGTQRNEQSIAHNHHGASDAYTALKDIGLCKEPVQQHENPPPVSDAPYIPGTKVDHIDVTERDKGIRYSTSRYNVIDRHLSSFNLSKKIRKYLINMSQVGYEYGKTRGKVCTKSISRIFAGHKQPRIFKQRNSTKIQTDTAVFILGDCSGSMSNKRYDVSAACQISISEVLQSLRIPHEMMQFSTSGSRAHYIMKRFGENFVSRDTLVKRYAYNKIYMGSNADGEAVTEAAQRLAMRPEENKILIVLSDGAPAYSNGGGDDDQFLIDTVREIHQSKIMNIIGVGIQTDDVEEYYPVSKVVNELGELEGVLLNLLREGVLK